MGSPTPANFNSILSSFGLDPGIITQLVTTIVEDTSCDEECKKRRILSELETALYNAEQQQATAPQQVVEARRKLITFRDGSMAYMQYETERLTEEAQEQIANLRTAFDRRKERVQNLTDQFEAIQTYSENLDELLYHNVDKKQRLTKNISDIKSSVFTNDRRYQYYEQSINWQWYVNMLVWIIYWLFTFVFIGYFLIFKGKFTEKTNVVYGLILLIIPFVLSRILVFEIYGYSISNIFDRFIQLFIFNKYDNYE